MSGGKVTHHSNYSFAESHTHTQSHSHDHILRQGILESKVISSEPSIFERIIGNFLPISRWQCKWKCGNWHVLDPLATGPASRFLWILCLVGYSFNSVFFLCSIKWSVFVVTFKLKLLSITLNKKPKRIKWMKWKSHGTETNKKRCV